MGRGKGRYRGEMGRGRGGKGGGRGREGTPPQKNLATGLQTQTQDISLHTVL